MAFKMGKNLAATSFTLLLLICGVYSVSASYVPSRILNRFVSNAFSMLMKWMGLSLKAIFRIAIFRRTSVKFEGGYDVETVFDGSKHGIEPYAVGVSPDGEILMLDSANSNLYKITSFLSMYGRPTLVTGSSGGYSGYVDGRLRQAMMNHPKGLAVDDRGNIYIADTNNMAIRKISDSGISTIAGGKESRGWGHVDGPSEDATFSNDFDVVYIRSSCSLLVIDRGNKAIREIQLHFDDCSIFYGTSFRFGITVVVTAVFFGYILALLQTKVGSILSSQSQKEPLIKDYQEQHQHKKHKKHSKTRHVPETLGILEADGPPPIIEVRDPTPLITHTVSKDPEKKPRLTKRLAFYKGWWDEDFSHLKKRLHRHQHHASAPLTYQQPSSRTANEVMFGVVQEQDK